MAEWCMAHPWLTFWTVIIALLVLDNIFENLVGFGNNCLRARLAFKGIKVSDVESKESDEP